MTTKFPSNPDFEKESVIYDVIQQDVLNPINFNEIEEIPKKNLNAIVFLLNVFWMLLCCHASLYFIFAPLSQGSKRGILAGIILVLTILVAIATFCYLTTFSKFIKLAIILDSVQIVTTIASLSFVSRILLFDIDDKLWDYKIIEIGFVIEVFCYSTMLRVMLVTLDWSKWQVIVFKLHAMMNCFMFFVSGIYFIYDDFSYTFHLLASFDKKVHDFMVSFIFTMFETMYQFYKKISDLDYAGVLKYSYKIKNVDQNLNKKKRIIVRERMQQIRSLKMIQKSQKIIETEKKKQKNISKFVSIAVMD